MFMRVGSCEWHDRYGCGVSTTDRDRHPPNPHRDWITDHEARPVQWFDCDSFVKPEFAQASAIAFGQRSPVDRANRGFVRKREFGEIHCD
jgi:hypothetical protein